MTAERPNAAVVKQVHHKGRKDKDRIHEARRDMRVVLSTEEGRRVLWTFIGECGIYREPVSPRGDEQQRLIGMQRVGLWMLDRILDAHDDAWLQMQREARARARADDAEDEAVRTVSSTEKLTGTATSDAQEGERNA